jgi:hypothetical protein
MADTYEITEDCVITFHDLFRGKEEDGFVLVGRQDIASYVSLPAEALELIDLLDSGMTVGEVKRFLEEKYGEEAEIEEFIEDMVANEMVKSVGDYQCETKTKVQKTLLSGITKRHVGWMFSKVAWAVYAGMAVVCLAIFAVFPHHIPQPIDVFWHPWYSVAVIFLFFFGWVLVAIHELAHLFGSKALGVEGNFSLSTRTIFVVAQTNINNIWTIPSEKRYIVYLAGMAWDTVMVFICLVVVVLTDFERIHISELWYNFLKAIVFIKVWGIIWQFRFNMQTDIYFTVTNYLKCKNLLGDTKNVLKNFVATFIKKIKKIDMSNIPEHEMRAIKFYTPFYLFGTLLIVITFFLRSLPILYLMVVRAVDGIRAGYAADTTGYIDAVVLIGLNVFNYGLLGYLTLKPRWAGIKQRILSVFT